MGEPAEANARQSPSTESHDEDMIGARRNGNIQDDDPLIDITEDCAVYKHDLQRRLKFLFMTPCDKVRAKRRFPWKLFLQIVKLVLCTLQVAFFGFSRSGHVNFLEKSTLALKHMYLQHWDPSYETLPYPPATGEYALYTIPMFYSHVNYAMMRYDKTQQLAIGTYHFSDISHPKMDMCKTFYREGKINASAETYEFDARQRTECFKVDRVKECNQTTGNCSMQYDIERYLHEHNKSINFDRIITLALNFSVKTVHLKELSQMSSPDCYSFGVQILYQNSEHNGQMLVLLYLNEVPLDCHGHIIYDVSSEDTVLAFNVLLDVLVIFISIVSFFLCLRSLVKSQMLRMETERYFQKVLHKKLEMADRSEFFNFWYLLILITDVLTVLGSISKILVETKNSHNYEVSGILLGAANLFVWFGVLRYFSFFDTFNVLTLTLKKAFPGVIRFLSCAAVFYFGFAVCGWVVLGPYHVKFRYLSTSSECLFSLVNGDDMFVTFSVIANNSPLYIWWFSRVYLYVFVSLFIYAVLNLFVAIILDAYYIIQACRNDGFPKTAMHVFIDECPDFNHLLMSDRHKQTCSGNLWCLCEVFCPCSCCRGDEDDDVQAIVIRTPQPTPPVNQSTAPGNSTRSGLIRRV